MKLLLVLIMAMTLFFPILSTVSAHSEVVVIEMTAAGFSPAEVTIDENTTVNFLNKDTIDRWPASDIHPTHEVFPEFDPKKPIAPGQFWLFKPKKVGIWKFHDHLLPHQRGVLTVTAEGGGTTTQPAVTTSTTVQKNWWTALIGSVQKFFTTIISWMPFVGKLQPTPTPSPLSAAAFKALSADQQFDYLRSIVTTQNSQAAWLFVLQSFQGQSGTMGNIHDLAHLAGQLLFQEKGFTGLSQCTPQFAFGCFHGFLDSAFKDNLDHLADAETACRTLGSGVSGPVASCIHGIGHGVASFYQTTKLTDALATCDRLQTDTQQYCYDGVFMEFERNASSAFYQENKPLYPCDELDSRYVFACGRNTPQVLLNRFKKNFGEAATICTDATNQDLKTACTDSLGFIAASQGGGDPQRIVGLCQQIATQQYRNRCMRAAAGELVFQEVPQWYTAAPAVCGALAASAAAECMGYIEHLMQEYGRIRPQTTGENPHSYIQSQMQVCLEHGGRDDCYKKVAQLLYNQFGLSSSLALLQSNESVPAVYARCHEVTHYLSRFEYEKNQSVPATYAQCDSTCHGGCYHGTLEAYLKEKQLSIADEKVKDAFNTVCGKPEDHPNLLVFYECMHGLGHAAMFITDMEIPQSLTLCDGLTAQNDRERCYSGVFMENSSSSTSTDHPGKYVRADDPLYPCNSLEEKYQQLCYRYQSSYFALIARHNWRDVVNLCLSVPGKYQNDCFRTIGTNQVGFTPDMTVMKRDCEMVPVEFRDTCFGGVIGSMAYRFVGSIDKMKQFCNLLDAPHQERCFQSIGASVVDWTNDTAAQDKYCAQTGRSEFVNWCTQGLASSRTNNARDVLGGSK